MDVGELRKEYAMAGLREAEAGDDPIDLFGRWFHEALSAKLLEPNAMTLATATPAGVPSARIVLLKEFSHEGFCFFTNLNSRKARELIANPRAALVFHWHAHERQVRIEGPVTQTTTAESDRYFASRPRGSRLGAWSSPQSEVISSRSLLDEKVAEYEAKYPGDDVPRPPYWGGFRVAPAVIEFWQGRPSRLHDRLRYTRQPDGTWQRERLAP